MPITTVVFDVGETLIDESRNYREWADFLGVPHHAFFAALGSVIERGKAHYSVFDLVRPGFDLKAAQREREACGWRYLFEAADFYPDALPCLAQLRGLGYRVGVAGNQPQAAEGALRDAGVEADFIASSARWGVEKPFPAFFAKIVETVGRPASEIAYVGDRLDNDVLPAKAAGLAAVFLRRGPWGYIQAGWPEAVEADLRLDSLAALAAALPGVRA
jgi:HAD superfamily hydrolase (TIGR01549 family)